MFTVLTSYTHLSRAVSHTVYKIHCSKVVGDVSALKTVSVSAWKSSDNEQQRIIRSVLQLVVQEAVLFLLDIQVLTEEANGNKGFLEHYNYIIDQIQITKLMT